MTSPLSGTERGSGGEDPLWRGGTKGEVGNQTAVSPVSEAARVSPPKGLGIVVKTIGIRGM